MKYKLFYQLAVGLLFLFQFCQYPSSINQQKPLYTIAVASSLKEKCQIYEQNYHSALNLNFIYLSSGKIKLLKEQGAPYDAIIVADKKFIIHVPESEIKNLFKEKVVRVSKVGEKLKGTFAYANPKLAPYGQKAEDWLNTTHKEFNKTVVGDNAFVVFEWLKMGLATEGVLPLSLAKKLTGFSISPLNTHIDYYQQSFVIELHKLSLCLND